MECAAGVLMICSVQRLIHCLAISLPSNSPALFLCLERILLI